MERGGVNLRKYALISKFYRLLRLSPKKPDTDHLEICRQLPLFQNVTLLADCVNKLCRELCVNFLPQKSNININDI